MVWGTTYSEVNYQVQICIDCFWGLHEDNPVELSSGDILHFGLPGVSNVTKEYNPPIITILKLQHPLKVGKKDMKEYDDYGNELSPSLLKMYK